MAVLCVTEQWTSVRVVRKEQGGVDERGADGAKEFVGDTDRAPKARGSRRRVGGVWEGVSPSPLREESGGLCPLRRKFFDIGTQNGGFWCILGAFLPLQLPVGSRPYISLEPCHMRFRMMPSICRFFCTCTGSEPPPHKLEGLGAL